MFKEGRVDFGVYREKHQLLGMEVGAICTRCCTPSLPVRDICGYCQGLTMVRQDSPQFAVFWKIISHQQKVK